MIFLLFRHIDSILISLMFLQKMAKILKSNLHSQIYKLSFVFIEFMAKLTQFDLRLCSLNLNDTYHKMISII